MGYVLGMVEAVGNEGNTGRVLWLTVGMLIGCSCGYFFGKESNGKAAREARPRLEFMTAAKEVPKETENKPMSVIKAIKPVSPSRPEVRLSGMAAFRGKKKVLLEIRVPGAGNDILNRALEELESANGVKVVSIDPVKGKVKLDIEGEESTRSFGESSGPVSINE